MRMQNRRMQNRRIQDKRLLDTGQDGCRDEFGGQENEFDNILTLKYYVHNFEVKHIGNFSDLENIKK